MQDEDRHFDQFAKHLADVIAGYKYGKLKPDDLTRLQKKQVELLVDRETAFRRALIAAPNKAGATVYQAFVTYVRDERGNVLAARPFFRERQEAFTAQVSPVLQERHWRRLMKFHANSQFVTFALRAYPFKPRSRVRLIAEQVRAARRELVELNLPLAVNRSRTFWRRASKSAHLEFMDFVQLAAEGLMAAVDKFCLPYTKVFRSVAIGRMVGNFIEANSETLLHFYPTDRRRIYRARSHAAKHPLGGVDVEKLLEDVNRDVDEGHRVGWDAMADLLAASSTVSADSDPGSEGGEEGDPGGSYIAGVARYAAPESARPDVAVEEADTRNLVRTAANRLPLLTRKVLYLRGVDVDLEAESKEV